LTYKQRPGCFRARALFQLCTGKGELKVHTPARDKPHPAGWTGAGYPPLPTLPSINTPQTQALF